MTVVLDSSALVKRYADELHHDVVRDIDEEVVVSDVSRVEVPSALWRKHRQRELTDQRVGVLISLFEEDWSSIATGEPAFSTIAISADVLQSAVVHVGRHGLKSLDAIHLATALLAQRHLAGVRFVCFDDQLRLAAQREGLALIP